MHQRTTSDNPERTSARTSEAVDKDRSSESPLTRPPQTETRPSLPSLHMTDPISWLRLRVNRGIDGHLSRTLIALDGKSDSERRLILSQPVDDRGRTLLHLATCRAASILFPELVPSDAKSAAGDKTPRSPSDIGRLVIALITLGADPFARDNRGRIPILNSSLFLSELPLRTALMTHSPGVPPPLKPHEKIFLFVSYAAATLCTGKNLEPLFEMLFPNVSAGASFPIETTDHTATLDPTGRYSLGRFLSNRYYTDDVSSIGAVLTVFSRLVDSRVCAKEMVTKLINEVPDEYGALLSHRIVNDEFRFSKTAELFLKLGGRFDLPGKAGDCLGQTAYHRAAKDDTFLGLCKIAPPNSLAASMQDTQGNTPALAYLLRHRNESCLLPASSIDSTVVRTPNYSGELPLKVALKYGLHDIALALMSHGASLPVDDPFFQRERFLTLAPKGFGSFHYDQRNTIFTVCDEYGAQLALRLLPSFLINSSACWSSLADAKEMGLAALAPTSPWTELAREAPGLFHSSKSWIVCSLAGAIEWQSDSHRDLAGFHPHEAELLLFAGLPLPEQRRRAVLAPIAFAISSTRRFLDNGIESVEPAAVSLWGEIGKIGYEFLNLKYDTRRFTDGNGHSTTLLEEYGCSRQEATLASVPWYQRIAARFKLAAPPAQITPPFFVLSVDSKGEIGSTHRVMHGADVGLQYRGAAPGTVVRWSKEFVTIESPEHGVIAIRNSSPEGGRACLLHPAYVLSPEKREQLLSKGIGIDGWNTSIIESAFTEVLDISLYPGGDLGPELQHASTLITQYRAVLRDYRAWLCDMAATSAYLEDPETGERLLVGGYKSKGFSVLLDALSYWEKHGENLQLESHPERVPAWHPYASLPANSGTISDLRRLTREDYTSPTLQSSGTFDFVQAGLNCFADIVVKEVPKKGGL